MQTGLHHPLHWMHEEATAVGHWCNMHILHDYHFWFYLLVAIAAIAFIVLLVLAGGSAMTRNAVHYYYVSPYGGF